MANWSQSQSWYEIHEPKDTQNSITKFSGELTREIYIHATANQGPGTKVVICVVGHAFAIPYSVEFATNYLYI